MATQGGDQTPDVYLPSTEVSKNAYVKSMQQYKEMHKESIENPQVFWNKIIEDFGFHFETPPNPDSYLEYNFDVAKGPISVNWMKGATTNVCYNVLDRNVKRGLGDKICFYW